MKQIPFYNETNPFFSEKNPFLEGSPFYGEKNPFFSEKNPFLDGSPKTDKTEGPGLFQKVFQCFSKSSKFIQVVSFETITPVDDSLLRVSRIGPWCLLIA